MFLMLLKYVKPVEEVERLLEEHVQFLDKYYNLKKFIFSGRRVPRTGGIILVDADSRDEVALIISEDPFHKHNIAEYEIIEFQPTKYAPAFSCFVEQH